MPLLAALAAGAAAVYGWGRAVAAAAAGAVADTIYDWSPKATQIIENPDKLATTSDADFAKEFPGGSFASNKSIAISDDNSTIVVGAPASAETISGTLEYNVGKVFVYEKNSSGVWAQVAELNPSDKEDYMVFGGDVAVSADGSTIATGAERSDSQNKGALYIFERPQSGWTDATETFKVEGTTNSSYFGQNVAITPDGNTVFAAQSSNTITGIVRVYTKTGGTWSYSTYFRASDFSSGDYFGRGISVIVDPDDDTNYILSIGASGSGAVYIFEGSGSTWTQRDKISNSASNFGAYNTFLSEDGNTLATGTNADKFYVYTYDGSAWSIEAEITRDYIVDAAGISDLPNPGNGPKFGRWVTMTKDGNTIITNEQEEKAYFTYNGSTYHDAGASYMFTRKNGSWNYYKTFRDELVTNTSTDLFGKNAKLSNDGTILALSAEKERPWDTGQLGRLYIYEANEKAFWEDGSLMETLDDGTSGSRYGASGDLSGTGEYAVVGAWGYNSSVGRAYIYKRSGSTWSQQAAIEAQDGVGANLEQMGYSSAMNYSGDTVAISQHNEDSGKGTVQVFTRSGTTWSHQAELQPTDLATNDYFGRGLAFAGSGIDISDNGDVVVVGASDQDSGGTSNTGAVYIFRRAYDNTWSQEAKLTVSPVTGNDRFGSAVAISGDGKYVVVGTPYEDGDSADSTSSAGVVYVFKKSESDTSAPYQWGQEARLVSSPSQEVSDYLGWSVAVNYDGTKIVSGAILDEIGVSNSGAAYIFTRSLTGTTWSLEAKIEPYDGAASDNFGSSVDISADGSIVVVGAKQDDDGGTSSGALYFFINSSGGWGRVKKIAGTYSSNLIGQTSRISSDGMYAIAGNYDYSSAQGRSYIYKATNTPVSYDWSTISAFNGFPANMPSSTSNTRFGCDTVISPNGEHAIVGAYNFNGGKGAFYYYKRSNPTSNFISYSNKTDAPDQSNNTFFGSSVAMNYRGDIAFIGAYNYSNGGAAYVYTRAGTTWTGSSAIQPSDIASGDELGKGRGDGANAGKGIAASYDGKTFVAGAGKHDHSTYSLAGAAWVFVESGGTWSQQAKLTASDAAANDYFGERLHISGNGNYVIAGARNKSSGQGAAYIFNRAEGGTAWSQEAKLVHPSPTNSDSFGSDVAIDEYGKTAVIGVRADDEGASNAGSAYVFIRNGTTWTQQAVLQRDSIVSGDAFGAGVSISADGNTIIVGAPDADDGGSAGGTLFVFTRSGTTWTQQGKVYPSGSSNTGFGRSINISPTGDFIIVGDAEQSSDAGRIFIYKTDADGS